MITSGVTFHDSTIISVIDLRTQLILSFENVYVDGNLRRGNITMMNIIRIVQGDDDVNTFALPFDEAQVIDLEIEAASVSMTIHSENYATHEAVYECYVIHCEKTLVNFF